MLHSEGLLLARGAFARFDHGGAFALVSLFREQAERPRAGATSCPAMLESLYTLPRRPALELPPDARITEVRTQPQPGVSILPDPGPWRQTHHRLEPFFLYGTHARRRRHDRRDALRSRHAHRAPSRPRARARGARAARRASARKRSGTHRRSQPSARRFTRTS